MGKAHDLTGQVFGDLTVIEVLNGQKGGEYLWRCRCVCGDEINCTSKQLRSNKNICRRKRIDDLTGRTFGLLTVEELMPQKVKDGAMYRCRCTCGADVYTVSTRLKRGFARGCDTCAPSKLHRPMELSGQKFGDLTVIERMENPDVHGRRWLCRCTCGEEVRRTSHQLIHGKHLCRHLTVKAQSTEKTKGMRKVAPQMTAAARENWRIRDRCGEIYGDLTVVKRLDERMDNQIMWLCRCICGEEVKRTSHQLQTNQNVCWRKRIDDLTGQAFGKLTVEELMPERDERYALYRCRCSCGKTVFANSRKLKRGSITGCGDCTVPQQHQPTIQSGDVFGDLTVLRRLEEYNGHVDGCMWLCRCKCGEEMQRTTKQLRNNRNTCRNDHRENGYYLDLTGRQLHQLTVLEKLDKRDKKGSVMWRCLCSCGKECEYSADSLVHGNIVSCGCYRQSFLTGEQLQMGLHHVDGTCVEFLQRKKRSDNTTGYTGVYRTPNGKWKAGITFKGKRYFLGTYDDMADAIRARQRGEELHDDFLEEYYKEHPEAAKKRRRIKAAEWVAIQSATH